MWLNPQEAVDFVTFTEEIFKEKLRFLCSESFSLKIPKQDTFSVQYLKFYLFTLNFEWT